MQYFGNCPLRGTLKLGLPSNNIAIEDEGSTSQRRALLKELIVKIFRSIVEA
jgi:hypothetical protein